jgi:hypothetical protein
MILRDELLFLAVPSGIFILVYERFHAERLKIQAVSEFYQADTKL